MPNQYIVTDEELREVWKAFHECGQSGAEATRMLGISRGKFDARMDLAVRRLGPSIAKPHVTGNKTAMKATIYSLPEKGAIAYYLCTSAQSSTHIHSEVWKNLLALSDHYAAKIMVSRFTYNKTAFGQGKRSKPSGKDEEEPAELFFAKELTDYIVDERVQLAPGLVYNGETQMLPTAKRPLSGFENYNGRKSSIFPHPKLAMVSVPAMQHEAAKLMYTTGCVTQRNYIQRREGFRAEQEHTYGALLVCVDHEGSFWCRQITAGPDYDIYDLDVHVKKGKVTDGNRVAGITWGDIHADKMEPETAGLLFGKGGMLDALKPHEQHAHDVLDFGRRGHHTRKSPHEMFRLHVEGQESVTEEFNKTAQMLNMMTRKWCEIVVPDANHHRHLTRWLEEANHRSDPINAIEMLSLQLALHCAFRDGDRYFNPFEHAMRQRGVGEKVTFLRPDESWVLLADVEGGIECGIHGDLGPNGSRGGSANFARMGRRANTAHSHTAGIYDGIFTAGHSCKRQMGYNHGPSSWSCSHTVTYPNGARAIVTVWNGRWKAEQPIIQEEIK